MLECPNCHAKLEDGSRFCDLCGAPIPEAASNIPPKVKMPSISPAIFQLKQDISPLAPYKGDQPYIFISYAHADAKKVYPIIKKLQEDGFRIWYDDGIDPGTEWDQSIADSIQRCRYFFAFLSRSYLQSENCKDEMNYARDLNPAPKRLLLYLEDVSLNGGMELRQSRIQAIHCYKYQSLTQMYSRIYEAPELEKCHEKGKKPLVSILTGKDSSPLYKPGAKIKRSRPDHRKGGVNPKLILGGAGAVIVLILALVFIPKIAGLFSGDKEEDDAEVLAQTEQEQEYGEMQAAEESVETDAEETAPTEDLKLISIQEPVEYQNFSIAEDVANTMGTTYPKAVLLYNWNSAYVRYNVSDYSRLTATYSVPTEGMESGSEFTLWIYLDENEDEPWLKEKLSRSTVETELDIDVSDAHFITFKVEGNRSCGLLLSDAVLAQ